MKIAVIGLGYVGCIAAGKLCEAGHEVIGVDINEDKVNLVNNGLPTVFEVGIKKIIDQTKQVKRETSSLLRSATSNRQSVYQHNLQAQKLTLKTADLYYNHLQQQLKKIEQATKIAQKDLQMAKNTFETVQLSIELLNLIKTNRNNFQQLLQLQLPELVPLSNIAMEKEYQRLTIKLSE